MGTILLYLASLPSPSHQQRFANQFNPATGLPEALDSQFTPHSAHPFPFPSPKALQLLASFPNYRFPLKEQLPVLSNRRVKTENGNNLITEYVLHARHVRVTYVSSWWWSTMQSQYTYELTADLPDSVPWVSRPPGYHTQPLVQGGEEISWGGIIIFRI